MQSVSQAFLDAMAQPDIHVVRSISYKRRYWNGSAYVWEGSWTALSEDRIVSTSAVTTQLDTQTENEFRISNVTVTLQNLANEWNPSNDVGKFAVDAGSPIYGYEPYWTKFRVQCGLIKVDGTTELLTVFTGVLTELVFNSVDGSAQATISGEQVLLVGANAESVSTSVVNETPIGVVDGANKVFTTAATGVGIIKTVTDNGVVKRAGTDYTISKLNDPLNPATITFILAPLAAHVILVTYTYWYVNQYLDVLVKDLLTQASIPSGNQNVSTVTFPNSIITTKTFTLASDWNTGTLSFIDDTTVANTLIPDYSSTAAKTNPGISGSTSGWSMFPAACLLYDGSHLGFIATSSTATRFAAQQLQPMSTGRWDVPIYLDNDTSGTVLYVVLFNSSFSVSSSGFTGVGYAVKITYPVFPSTTYTFQYVKGGTGSWINVGSSQTAVSSGVVPDFLTVVRYPSGLTNIVFNGVQIISVTDTTYGSGGSRWFGYEDQRTGDGSLSLAATDITAHQIQVAGTSLTGTWTSPVYDLGTTPSTWQPITNTQSGSLVTIQTASSSDNITYDAYVSIIGTAIQSVLRRYLKVQVVLGSTLTTPTDPRVSALSFGWQTFAIAITLANFTGLTCYDAVTACGNFANYEFGFDEQENFFFRSKTTSASVLTLSQATNVIAILSSSIGYNRLATIIRATYGSYTAEIDDPGGYNSPSARIGYALYQPPTTSLLISGDANVALGIAQLLFNFYSKSRRRVKVSCKFLPQLQLSDVVTLNYIDDFPEPAWYWGDTDVYWGMIGLYYYGGGEQLYYNFPGKVVGIRLDTDAWTSELDLEEVV